MSDIQEPGAERMRSIIDGREYVIHTEERANPVSLADAEWNAWATLANDVTDALKVLPQRFLFSRRNAVAQAMWDAGYRPTEAQIAAVRERQTRAEGDADA